MYTQVENRCEWSGDTGVNSQVIGVNIVGWRVNIHSGQQAETNMKIHKAFC